MPTYQTFSSRETKALGARLGRKLLTRHPARARVIALRGELGAGKTTFIKGVIRGVGIKKRVTSPTFILWRKFEGKAPIVYHVDCYRVKKPKELAMRGFEEIFNDSRNVVLIEWPEVIQRFLPKDTIWIYFTHGARMSERKIISARRI